MNLLKSDLYVKDLVRASNNIDLFFLNNKSILITGGLGLIGSAIVDLLIESRLIFKIEIDIYVGARNQHIYLKKYSEFPFVHFVMYDALKPLEFQFRPDFIIHSAGVARPDLYMQAPVETLLSNIEGIKNLLEFSKDESVKKMLYISSSEVYGRKESNEPFMEEDYGEIQIDDIRSSYPIAKIASEMLCRSFASQYDLFTIIARPGHVFGPSASHTDKRIASDFAYKAARGEALELKSPGKQKRSYCYSIDAAVQVLTILHNGEKGTAYNIGSSEIISIREMAEIFAKAGNVKLIVTSPTEDEKKVFNPMINASLDNNKVINMGYQYTFSVTEGLIHTVNILKELL